MYDYQKERAQIFTESGSVTFTKIRDAVRTLLKTAGAFTMGAATRGVSGDSWLALACVDRLAELGEVVEVGVDDPPASRRKWGQDRVFVLGPKGGE